MTGIKCHRLNFGLLIMVIFINIENKVHSAKRKVTKNRYNFCVIFLTEDFEIVDSLQMVLQNWDVVVFHCIHIFMFFLDFKI